MLRHIQNRPGSIYGSNTATSQDNKNQIVHHRNFQSQLDTTNNISYNNCWVCSLNVIKSRDGNKYSALEDIISNHQAFNNVLEGIDIIEGESLFKELNVQKNTRIFFFYKYKRSFTGRSFQ